MEGGGLRTLGLDVGERRIGVAVSDPTGTITSPLPAIHRAGLEDDLRAVTRLAEEQEAEAIVVGLPVSLNGRLGPQARRTQEFIRSLSRESPVPVHSHDERFSTVEAERLLRATGRAPSRDKGLRDSAAACVILQAYLDARRG